MEILESKNSPLALTRLALNLIDSRQIILQGNDADALIWYIQKNCIDILAHFEESIVQDINLEQLPAEIQMKIDETTKVFRLTDIFK